MPTCVVPPSSTPEFGAQRPRLDASIVDTISHVDGVAAAEGKVSGYAQLVDAIGQPVGDPGQGAPTFGESWMTVAELNPYRIAEGHAPSRTGRDRHRSAFGQDRPTSTSVTSRRCSPSRAAQQFTVAGIATFGDADSMGGASAVLFDAPTAEALVAEPGQVDACCRRRRRRRIAAAGRATTSPRSCRPAPRC